jgi:MarR family transcriptional regulator for hemolysin
MPRGPAEEPIGRLLASVSKAVSRAFDAELAAAGGSQAVWLVLLALKRGGGGKQRDLAAAVGIEGPTVTHHLDGLEKAGLVRRERDPDDRRAVRVELTPDGEALFLRLARAARAFDERLRDGLADAEIEAVRTVLRKLHANVT